MKEFTKRQIKFFLRYLTRRTNNKLIKRKLEIINKENKYKKFPVNQVTPVIQEYSFFRKTDLLYLDFFYSSSGLADSNFLSLPVYYNVVEPVLNDISQLKGIKDKNFLDLFLSDFNTPATILRKMNHGYYDRNFKPININDGVLSNLLNSWGRVIIKPSNESGAGKSIILFRKKNNLFYDDSGRKLDFQFLKDYPDFVLQEAIEQHKFFKQFNPDSNNTVRILSYRSIKDEKLHILHRLLRVGVKGSFLDHDNKGGIAVGISDLYTLHDHGFNLYGERLDIFNGINFKNIKTVPFIQEMEAISRSIAPKIIYGRVLAFDFTVDIKGQVLLLEINAWRNGISQYQMNNGSLFANFTKEILDFCEDKEYNHIIKI